MTWWGSLNVTRTIHTTESILEGKLSFILCVVAWYTFVRSLAGGLNADVQLGINAEAEYAGRTQLHRQVVNYWANVSITRVYYVFSASLSVHVGVRFVHSSSWNKSHMSSSLLWTQLQFLQLSVQLFRVVSCTGWVTWLDKQMWLVDEWTTAGVIGTSSPSDWSVPDTMNTITLCYPCWGQHGRHSWRGWWKQLIGQLISLAEECHSPERRRSSGRVERTTDAHQVSEIQRTQVINSCKSVSITALGIFHHRNNKLMPS